VLATHWILPNIK